MQGVLPRIPRIQDSADANISISSRKSDVNIDNIQLIIHKYIMENSADNMSARDHLAALEGAYITDWEQDANALDADGHYQSIAEIVDPKDGRFVVDIATGLGKQLIWLAVQNPKGLYIGTERTPQNVVAAAAHLEKRKLASVAIQTQQVELSSSGKLYWKQKNLPGLQASRDEIMQLLQQYVLFVDDDIRNPQSLPVILGGEKLDAAIFSMPGGSAARAWEWPYAAEEIDRDEMHRRVSEATARTRMGFFHYASSAVRDGGKIVIAERMTVPKGGEIGDGFKALADQIGGLQKYWKVGRGFHRTMGGERGVPLVATHDGRILSQSALLGIGHSNHIAILELLRTKTDFSEPPLPSPEA